ncbi:MAG: bifunctional 5,10-methylenetetrahydrofolate dehydrogenase/5,10-methenyltetrahydrofolate cyclohydrolase [bacterium]|nr:bifunctional 5,10-methylenetetrahydrofolate dehydrogenase/5,10-methenyltetrahydrofolate cyclohydrolase [bacterium]
MKLIDGRSLAEKIRYSLKAKISLLSRPPVLGIIEVGNNPVIGSFVKIKKKIGDSLGVEIKHKKLKEDTTTDILIEQVKKLSPLCDGVIVQLPLPSHISTDEVLNAIPLEKDIDVLSALAIDAYRSRKSIYLPPVAGAVGHILIEGGYINFGPDRIAVVVGKGRLVGQPVFDWFKNATNMVVEAVDDRTPDIKKHTFRADIIVSGAGVPGLITPDMVGLNSVLIDAGTSEQGGKLVGDIDPVCYEKCFFYTPVPGGVGPVTVAVLYENLVKATQAQT